MRKINLFLYAALSLALILSFQSCVLFNDPESKSDPADCYVPNAVTQDTFEIDGESLVWEHNDTIAAHLIVYELLDDDMINLAAQKTVTKQQQNNPTLTDIYSVVTRSDTFSLAEIPYSGAVKISVYSIDLAGKIGATPVVYTRAACSIITTDVMMLANPNCAASTIVRSAPALSPGTATSVGWSSAPDSLYHCTITKGTAITSKFTLKLRINPTSGKPEWAPIIGCSSMNSPTRSGSTYSFYDALSGLKYEVTGTCTGFNITNKGALGSGKIAVTVRKN